jgi:NitT/TauT family transport system substrate-binding protein
MKNIKFTRILTLLLAVCMLAVCVSCGTTHGPATLDNTLPIRVSVLNGTTGFGIAKLMSDHTNGNAALNYSFAVETDAANINAGLIKGEIDIAALPTNAASNLYNKTNGEVTVLALNTLGVLYVVENGSTVKSLADLEGKTVYCPAQNPAFIFEAICRASGVNVTIDTTYAQPAALMSVMAESQEGMLAVLPQPVLTVAMSKNQNLTVALDLTAEWKNAVGSDSLVQGCIVVRNEFLSAHPNEVVKFLEEYKASIEFVNQNPTEASEMVVELGIYTGAAAVAAKAIPSCNIVYMDGNAMKTALSAFLETMYGFMPASVGGALPADNFYFIPVSAQ